MTRHFHEELMELKHKLLSMGLLVEQSIHKAVESLANSDPEKAQEVLTTEDEINQFEIDIDDQGHSLLALEQPLAVDLRRITMILKINTDLERMGDHAVNIAQRALRIIKKGSPDLDQGVIHMANSSKKMLKESLDAFINEDADLARDVLKQDDEVDRYNRDIARNMRHLMEAESTRISYGVSMTMISYNLERIADLANNIAEDVIYIKQGIEVKHHTEDAESDS